MAAIEAFNRGGVRDDDGVFRFVYFSASSAGKTPFVYGRVKAQAEQDLNEYAAKDSATLKVSSLRPGYFFPSNSDDAKLIRSPFRRGVNTIASSLFYSAGLGIRVQDLSRAAVEVAKGKFDGEVLFSNDRMKEIAEAWKGAC